MEEVFVLPTKRANVEIGSGSGEEGEEARKKAKTDFVYDFSQFTHPADFCEFYEDTSPQDPYIAWIEYENSFREKIRLREIQLFLKSEGREAEAMEIQSLNDQRAREIKDSWEFNHRGWILRPNLGPYTDYQRLYVDSVIFIDHAGELNGDYCDLFCTHDSDIAFVAFFEELRAAVTWDMSSRDTRKKADGISKKYPDLQPETLDWAINEILYLKQSEQTKKELVPFFTKLWQEIVEKKREAMEVLVDIKNNDGALYPISVRSIVTERRKDSPKILQILEHLKSHIQVAPKDAGLEDCIYKYFHPVRERMPIRTYASYVNEKFEVAAKLGLE